MKKATLGILLGLAILCHPVQSHAHERQCPQAIEITYWEAQELMQIASAEALNQGVDGMLYVMSVVINRVNSDEFPNDIHGVIHQPYQFYTDGMGKAQITPEVHEALAMLEAGNLYPAIVAFETKSSRALDVYFYADFVNQNHRFYVTKK